MPRLPPNLTELLGYAAATLTTLAFVPQVIRTWRSGSAETLSWGMLIVFSAGVGLWLLYGAALRSMPIIVANAITLVLSVLLLVMKHRFRTGAGPGRGGGREHRSA